MNPEPSIIHALEQLAGTGSNVRLMNVFRGIPVVFEAFVGGSADLGMIFKVHKYQLVCLELEKYTYITSDVLPAIIKAGVVHLDYRSDNAVLNNFSYVSDTIGCRTAIRVEPRALVPVTILTGNKKLTGNLADISVDGIGVLVLTMYLYNPKVFQEQATVQVRFKLPDGENKDNQIPGHISYITEDNGAYRVGFNIFPDANTRKNMMQFIGQRQVEILREVKILSELFHRLKAKERH